MRAIWRCDVNRDGEGAVGDSVCWLVFVVVFNIFFGRGTLLDSIALGKSKLEVKDTRQEQRH